MKISDFEMLSDDLVKVYIDSGSSFYMRFSFLQNLSSDKIINKEELTEEEAADLTDAGLIFAAERKAEDYLARCEQSRFGLTRKLVEKGFDKKYVSAALDWLVSKNYLSDERFAGAWLRGHILTKFQGRSRLLNELLIRGIDRNTATKAIDELFETADEEELCRKAYEKQVAAKKQGDKLIKAMLDAGFSYKMIQKIQKELKSPIS